MGSGLGPVLIPLSSVLTAGATALPTHLQAALQSIASNPQMLLGAPAAAVAPAVAPAPAPAAASLAALVPHLPQIAPPAALTGHGQGLYKADASRAVGPAAAGQEPHSSSLRLAQSASKAGGASNSPDRSQFRDMASPSGEEQIAAGVVQAHRQEALGRGIDTDGQAAGLSDGECKASGLHSNSIPGGTSSFQQRLCCPCCLLDRMAALCFL